MKMSFLCASVLCTLLCSGAWAINQNSLNKHTVLEKWYKGNIQGLNAILSIPQMPQRYLTGHESFYSNVKTDAGVLGFSWQNCGSSSDPVQIRDLSVQPDPISIPGTVTLSFDVLSAVNVTEPLEVDLTLEKKVAFWWVQIPCIDNVGSCSYNDFCTMLPATCPVSFQQYDIPCHCPALQGEYILPSGSIDIPSLPLPSWATSGDYWAQIVGNSEGTKLFCYEIYLSLN